MRWTTREPCASCPYRRDAPLRFWDASHFRDLLRADADPVEGPIYGCHGTAKMRAGPSVCAGWLLDQKERGVPSIRLRLSLVFKPEAVAALEEVTDGGHAMYRSLQAMCRANGVRKP